MVAILSVVFMVLLVGRINDVLQEQLPDEKFSQEIKVMADNTPDTADNMFMILFFGFHLVLFISAWLVPSHPLFMIFFIFVLIPLLMLQAVALQTVYDQLSTGLLADEIDIQLPMMNRVLGNIQVVSVVLFFTYLAILYAKGRLKSE